MGIVRSSLTFDGACKRSPVVSLWPVRRTAILALFLLAACLLAGCVTVQQRGDRAYKSGKYNQALDRYEEAMDRGVRDPQMYYHAAKAAVHVGDFSLAERYYSQSLRYGGGDEVARSLAEFYIATSNYAKAVRVLQQLLETTNDPQDVYNNLGAALMYAGVPLDAESYLLVAQQMKPDDPVPYVNLGVLYDKHMHQPRLALGFYKCFVRMSKAGSQQRKVAARVKALEAQEGKVLPPRFDVPCGKAYQPPSAPSADEIRKRLGAHTASAKSADTKGEAAAGSNAETKQDTHKPIPTGIEASGTGDKDAQGADDEPPLKIYRPTEDHATPPKADAKSEDAAPQHASTDQQDASDGSKAVALAEQAFAKQDYAQVVRQLEKLPASALDAKAMSLYGRALAAQGHNKRAQRWLAGAVAADPTPKSVRALLDVYGELGADKKFGELCAQFAGDKKYHDALARCPKPGTHLQKTSP